jgi:glycolate oxidase FAD binding subunit
MAERLEPATAEELAAAVAESEGPLEILGQGSKRDLGRPVQVSQILDLSRLTGVTLYEPEELVLSAGAGTTVAEIERLLTANGQMLAFEPPDLGPLFGQEAGRGTLGGMIACNLAGPRRIKAGALRDHLLGATAVNGRGEIFKTGGRVMKNVTGYDLCKLLAGSFGTLAAIASATLKLQPAPEAVRTLMVRGLEDSAAMLLMSRAVGSAEDVSGAAHLPEAAARHLPHADVGKAVTLLRLEGTPRSVAQRLSMLAKELEAPSDELGEIESTVLWRGLRNLSPFRGDHEAAIWRLSVPPTAGADVLRACGGAERHFYDWGGGLIWLAVAANGDAGAQRLRAALSASGGHATLVRAPIAIRAAAEVFQPQEPALAALSRRVKESFDPAGRFNPGRMYVGI